VNTRQQMTALILELWAENPDHAEIALAVRREFPGEPPSVHDAAWTAAIGQTARRLAGELGAILKRQGMPT
jgi:hypothetical protein